MLKLLLAWCCVAACPAGAAQPEFQLDVKYDLSLKPKAKREAAQLASKVKKLLSEWSFTRKLTGDWELTFLTLESALDNGFSDDDSVAWCPPDHKSKCQLYIIWERLMGNYPAPILRAYELVAVNLFTRSMLSVNSELEVRLYTGVQNYGQYEALKALEHSPTFGRLNQTEKAHFAVHLQKLAAHNPPLTPAETRWLDCGFALSMGSPGSVN